MLKVSPLHKVHTKLGAKFQEYDGWEMPSGYGDINHEQKALENGCAAFDLSSFARISVKGGDSENFIKSLIPDCQIPPQDQTDKYKNIRIANTSNGYLLITLPGQRDHIMEKANANSNGTTVQDITEKTAMLGLYGPRSVQSADRILAMGFEQMKPGQIQQLSFFMISVTVIRDSWTGADGIEMIVPSMAAPIAAGAIHKYKQREGIVPAGMEVLNKNLKK